MFPLSSNIQIDKSSSRSIYLQIADQIIFLIKSGHLAQGTILPSSRSLASALQVHRKTVTAAYESLSNHEWITSIPGKGTFVSDQLPIVEPRPIADLDTDIASHTCNFDFQSHPILLRPPISDKIHDLQITDGIPDERIVPIEEISKNYRSVASSSIHRGLLNYNSPYGLLELREELAKYLHESRGIRTSAEHILVTKGSQMAIYLSALLLLSKGGKIAVGETNYMTAEHTFLVAGGRLIRIPVDKDGMDTRALERMCERESIKAVYITSHHHHPTTVTLSAERRMHLLEIAKKHKIAIIEDDYDYDFHYDFAPILPLASHDTDGNVIYVGGFTKIIAPGLRVGYMVAPRSFIDEASRMRRIIDRQGDQILEYAVARMLRSGDIQRQIQRQVKIYRDRRDLFCSLLKEKLGNYLSFATPEGGMAVWVMLDAAYSWDRVISLSDERGLTFSMDYRRYDNLRSGHNGIRMGFSTLDLLEIPLVIDKLVEVFRIYDKGNKGA